MLSLLLVCALQKILVFLSETKIYEEKAIYQFMMNN